MVQVTSKHWVLEPCTLLNASPDFVNLGTTFKSSKRQNSLDRFTILVSHEQKDLHDMT